MIILEASRTEVLRPRIHLPISKSVANRELVLAALAAEDSPSLPADVPDDVRILHEALFGNNETLDVGHAGTAMRFATAYFSLGSSSVVLRGSDRMHQRPIGILVDTLRQIGARIEYMGVDGYPPLRISPTQQIGGEATIDGSISSQFISALLLCAASMTDGLHLTLTPPVTSKPYIDLTLHVMQNWGIAHTRTEDAIHIAPQRVRPKALSLTKDWSAAAFFYGLVAQGHPETLVLEGLDIRSAQGDQALVDLFIPLGVQSTQTDEGLVLQKVPCQSDLYSADLSDQPDLAQAIAFTCAAIGRPCYLTGLHTLRIKETDRIAAIKECLEMIGLQVETTADSLRIAGSIRSDGLMTFESYEDHRMAMAISILAPRLGRLAIKDEAVVSKSFPTYWKSLEEAGLVQVIRT